MKALAVVFFLVSTTGVFAQTTRSFGSVVFPGGTSATTPGTTRNFGSVVFPGGSAVPTVRGGSPAIGVHPPVLAPVPAQARSGQSARRTTTGRNTRNTTQPYVYAYPVYVGGSSYDNGASAPPQDQPAPPPQNITVVYPPSGQRTPAPVMIQAGPDGQYYTNGGQNQGAMIYEPTRAARVADDQAEPSEPNRYLIAFKDHTIYSAVAYWADGDTLHYFTSGNTHNQASVSLIDRELTERLNKEMGTDFKLPAAK